MPLKLLAVGDMHLGRYPSRLPAAFASDRRALGPAGAWERVVEHAIRAGVDVVALAGDVVEREDDFFEAYRSLQRGVQRLTDADIRVVGVAGNHDVKVLPRLAEQLPGFHLLGAGGEWESWTLEAAGTSVTLHGWSFPKAQVPYSPLDGAVLSRGPGLNLGLLHCDRDQTGSRHAPVRSSELAATDLDGWMLGHIHAPDPLSVDRPSGYLGCISGMDPGEPGDHGPWLFTIDGGRLRALQQWVLAPLRWETIRLDLTDLEDTEQARSLLLESLREPDARLGDVAEPPRAVGVRLSLEGRSAQGPAVARLFEEEIQNGAIVLDGPVSGAGYFIEHSRLATRPVVDLARLATQNDPVGLLARRLLWLDEPDGEAARRFIGEARSRLVAQADEARWQELDDPVPDEAAVIDHLREAGTRLLDAMLTQQEDDR